MLLQNRMRKFIAVFIVTIIVTISSAQADTTIAIVDLDRMLSESDAAKNIREQVQTRRDKFLEELKKREETLRGLEEKMLESREKNDPEAFAKERAEFEKKFQETRAYNQENKSEIEKAMIQAIGKLRKEVFKIVEAVASENDYELVMAQQSIIVAKSGLNISDEVFKRLNENVKKIKVE